MGSSSRKWRHSVLAVAPLLAGLAGLPTPAQADDFSPVVVVVESADRRVSASELRLAIAREGIPAYALSDDAAPTAQGTLTVAIPRGGPVRMRFTDPAGHTRTRELALEHAGRAIVLARVAVRLVRESRHDRSSTSREVLDPWRDEASAPAVHLLVEVLDPWGEHGENARRLPPYSEVLDPWAADRAPRDDAPAVSVISPEVIDPWAAENGRRLDSPRR